MTDELSRQQRAGLFEGGAIAAWGVVGLVATANIGGAFLAAGTAALTIMALHRSFAAEVDRADGDGYDADAVESWAEDRIEAVEDELDETDPTESQADQLDASRYGGKIEELQLLKRELDRRDA